MTDLSPKEKTTLEKIFKMENGYFLDFSNQQFDEYFSYHLKNFKYQTDLSKKNNFKEILKNRTNFEVSKLLKQLADDYFHQQEFDELDNPNIMLQRYEELRPEYDNSDYCRIIEIATRIEEKDKLNIKTDIQNFESLSDFIKETEELLNTEKYWDVITRARTILEIIFKEICSKRNLEFCEKDINTTFTNIRKYFGMDAKNDKYPNYLKNLITSSATLVNNIAEARNSHSSSHAPKINYKPKRHHAKFILEQSLSLINFIIEVDKIS